MKITITKDDFTVETETKTRSYSGEGEEESERLKTLMESEFAKDPDFEPDDVYSHMNCGQGTTLDGEPHGCSLPTLECYFGYPKFMPDMPQYGETFMAVLAKHQRGETVPESELDAQKITQETLSICEQFLAKHPTTASN